MRILIISETINRMQRFAKSCYRPPYDVHLDIGDLNREDFNFCLFDYDVSIIHISEPAYHTHGFYTNLPKLLEESFMAFEQGHSVICLPDSRNFISKRHNEAGMSAYDWLIHLGVQLQENEGEDIKPSGSGNEKVIQEYLEYVPRYYQTVIEPASTSGNRLAIAYESESVIGLEHEVGKGILVILPPPNIQEQNYCLVMSRIIEIAHRYHGRSQGHIHNGDMRETIPRMLRDAMDDMDSDELIKTVHDMMPQMMEKCLTAISEEQRRNIFTFCHRMLEEMEGRFLSSTIKGTSDS